MPSDACPTCGAQMAPDQRYCLSCGSRRGDPRLPFMDAVTFMEASKQPAAAAAGAAATPPPPTKSRISPSTTLVAGIATLVLAVGVGVLIGQGGNDSAPVAQQPKTQVIQVGGSGPASSEESAETATAGKASKEAKKAAKSKGGGKKSNEKAPEDEVGSSGTSKAAEEVLKPSADAKPLPPPTTKVGESCDKGTAGCSDGGEFNGSFFE